MSPHHSFVAILLYVAVGVAGSDVTASSQPVITRQAIVNDITNGRRRINNALVQRLLTLGDFDSLNSVLSSVHLPIDESPVITETVAGSTLTIALDNITCSHLQLGDVAIDWAQSPETTNSNNIRLTNVVKLKQVDLDCHMLYTYDYLFFSGSGGLDLLTGNSTITTMNNISSSGSSQSDIQVNMTSCRASIQIQDMVFDGDGLGILGSALNTVEGLVRSTVADKMQAYLCSFLGQFQEPLQNGLTEFTKLLDANATAYEPLRIESNLKVPRTVDLVNFKNPKGSSSSMDPQIIDTLMGQISGYLSATTDDGELNLNRLLQDSILDDDGGVNIDLTTLFPASGSSSGVTLFENSNELGDWTMRFTSAHIFGLDSFCKVNTLKAIGKYTLESTMAMDGISVQLDAALEITTPERSLTEKFVLNMTLNGISLSVALLLAIDMNTLGQLPLGALVDMSNILPCISSSIYRLKGTGLDVQTMTLEKPVISGFESPGLQRIMSQGLGAIFAAYNPLLSDALPNLIESAVLGMLDTALAAFVSDNGASSCSVSKTSGSETFVDFRDLLLSPREAKDFGGKGTAPYGDLSTLVKGFVDDQLLKVNAETGRTGLAEMFIVPMTTNQSGTPGTLAMYKVVSFAGNIDIGEETAFVSFNVRDVQIDNLDSIGDPLRLLEPVRDEPNLINNTVTFGVEPEPLQLQAKVLIDIEKDDLHIYNDVSFSVLLNSASAAFALLMKMSEHAVMSFPVQDIFLWDCWLATVPAPSLDAYGMRQPDSEPSLSLAELAMSIASMNFTVECMNCSSSRFEEFAAMVSSSELNLEVVRSATNVINLLLHKISGRFSFLQTSLDRLLVDAGKFCPHSPQYDPNASRSSYSTVELSQDNSNLDSMIALLTIMLSVAIFIVVIYLCLRQCVARRHRKWLETLPKGQVWAIYENQVRERTDVAAVNINSNSLFQSKQIPFLVRVLAPVVLIGNIGLFLSGHLSKGGTVALHISVGEQKVAFTDFYTFSIAQTGIELWGAGYRPLALLMLIVSGIWPYTKQLITVFLWFLPPSWVSTATRGRALCIMDFLAKWSMVDVFVMIVSLAAFRVRIQSPDLSFIPDELYQIDILVVPVWGLYANMLAQILSQVTSHFIVGYHRLVVFEAQKQVECERRATALARRNGASEMEADVDLTDSQDGGNTSKRLSSPTYSTTSASVSEDSQEYDNYPLYRHAFLRPHRGESEKLIARPGVNAGLVILSVAIVVLVIVGCSLPSVSFDYQGVVGIAVESGQDFRAAKEYVSVFSLAKLLMNQARFLDTVKDLVGMLSVSILLLLSVFFVPLALVAVMLVEWFSSHSLKVRRRLRSAVEILQAWQYIEVLVLSIIVGAWQIGDVSELLLDDYCGGDLGGTLSELASFGIISPEDAKCFRVQAAIEPASFILVAAGVLIIVLSAFLSMAVAQRTRDEIRCEMNKYMGPCEMGDDDLVPVDKIDPVPVLFTDQFRWLLQRQ